MFSLKNAVYPFKLVVFLLSYPLAALLKRLPDSRPELKNVFNIRYGL